MASWDGGSGSGGYTPSDMRQLSPRKGQITPESEERVLEETEDVVRNFLFERYTEDLSSQSDDSSTETAPNVLEFMNYTADPLSQASQVGRQLAKIGDDINRRYADEFSEMIGQLRITQDTAYDVFARIARKIFAEGINWGRVAALLCFAYRIVIEVLKQRTGQFAQFVKLIVHHVVRFIRERIVHWIVEQGGWRDALNYRLPTNVGYIAGTAVCCIVAIAAVLYFNRGS